MKALVFAAGIGSRLKPFTEHHPKALVPVCGVPMLQRVLEKIGQEGISDVVVNVHHYADQIVEFLQSRDNFGLNLTVSDESDCLLDTGGGLLKALPLLDLSEGESVLIHNADILTDAPIGEMAMRHHASNADVTLLGSERTSSRMLHFSASDQRLCGWENVKTGEFRPDTFKPSVQESYTLAFGGVHIVNASVMPLLESYGVCHGASFSIIPFYLEHVGRLNIRAYNPPPGSYMWHDVGTMDKLHAAELNLARKEAQPFGGTR